VRFARAATAAAATLALSGGVMIGLSTGTVSAGHAATTATSTGATTATSTGATIPEPVVTTVTQPTVPSEDLPGTGKPTIVLGDMNTPEQFIIGQLYEIALEAQGYTITLTRNIGLPSKRTWALQHNTLSIYPEYLGEWNSTVAHLHRRFRTLRASYRAARDYARRHGLVLLPPTPFSDTSCVAVLTQYATANHVRSIPQLARGGPIVFGAPNVFQYGSDGVPALERSYHLHPSFLQPIGYTLQYWWLRTGNVQAAYCSTTDPALTGPKYVALADPKSVFGHGNVVPVTTEHVLRVEGPKFAETIEAVDALLTQRAMRGLNAEIELGGHLPPPVAEQFLQGNGLLPPVSYAPVTTTTTTSPTGSGS
jgi:osmoprotectant transport system substrate-binding protein